MDLNDILIYFTYKNTTNTLTFNRLKNNLIKSLHGHMDNYNICKILMIYFKN